MLKNIADKLAYGLQNKVSIYVCTTFKNMSKPN